MKKYEKKNIFNKKKQTSLGIFFNAYIYSRDS